MGKRRTYTAEFKRQAVRMVVEQGLSVFEVAVDLDVHANLLRKWKNQFEAEGGIAMSNQGRSWLIVQHAGPNIRRIGAESFAKNRATLELAYSSCLRDSLILRDPLSKRKTFCNRMLPNPQFEIWRRTADRVIHRCRIQRRGLRVFAAPVCT